MHKLLVAMAAVAILGLAGNAQARDLKLAEIQKGDHFLVQSEQTLANKAEQLTNGQLKIAVRSGGELGNELDSWKKVQAGTIDIARVGLSSISADVPTAHLLSLPYIFHSQAHMWKVLDGEVGKRLATELQQKGVVLLAYYSEGARSFYTNKRPLRNSSDFKGLRIRSLDNPIYRDLMTELGATPVVIPFEKTAEALQNGQIDAAENSLDSYISSGHSKYAKYFCMDEHFIVPDVLVISLKTWNTLSPAEQNALRTAAKESMDFARTRQHEVENQLIAKARKDGITIVEHEQINVTSIEGYILKLYTKYVTNDRDLQTVMDIIQTK
jgi:tripartite ATP-independent transporter DctP family solute receptor